MEQYGYARQKLWEALHILVGDGDIKVRLGHAQNLLLLLQPDTDLPEELRGKFRALMSDLSKRAIHYSYQPTRINTRHPKAGRMAETILSLYTELRGGI